MGTESKIYYGGKNKMEHLKRLEESLVVLENSADKLSQIPQLLKSVIDLVNEIQSEKSDLTKSCDELRKIKSTIENQSKDICNHIEEEKKTREEFITTMKSILIQNNKENIEVYNALSTTISHKIDMVGNQMDNTVSDGVEKLSKTIIETESKIEQSCENIHVDVKETKTIMPVVLRTQILVIVAIIIGVIGCILNFV